MGARMGVSLRQTINCKDFGFNRIVNIPKEFEGVSWQSTFFGPTKSLIIVSDNLQPKRFNFGTNRWHKLKVNFVPTRQSYIGVTA